MTMRVTFGCDPGLTGAVVALIDGEVGPIIDMPTREVKSKQGKAWKEIDAATLSRAIRAIRSDHPGAYVSACVEKVGARPGDGGTSAFRFGDSAGAIRGVLESLNIPIIRVIPAVWKRHYGLIGTEKDAARLLAIKRFPNAADRLKLKKHDGRADALLIALWNESTQV